MAGGGPRVHAPLQTPALGRLAGGGRVVLRGELGKGRVDRLLGGTPLEELRPQPRPPLARPLLPALHEQPRRGAVVEILLLRQPVEGRGDFLLRIPTLGELHLQLAPEVGAGGEELKGFLVTSWGSHRTQERTIARQPARTPARHAL